MKDGTFASLNKAIDILGLFSIEKRDFTAQEISQALGMPLSSVYKYLEFLTKKQILRSVSNSNRYGLGLMIASMATVLEKDFNLIDELLPYMETLRDETSESVILSSLIGKEAVCLEILESPKFIKLVLEKGRRLPLHTGASSKIVFAFQSDEFIDEYIAEQRLVGLTEQTITDPHEMMKEVNRIRENGFAVSDSEVDTGIWAMAIPIIDAKGRFLAGLTVAGPSERIGEQQRKKISAILKKQKDDISKKTEFFTGI
jgi:DNA-binding IclR family transcriptional regulator